MKFRRNSLIIVSLLVVSFLLLNMVSADLNNPSCLLFKGEANYTYAYLNWTKDPQTLIRGKIVGADSFNNGTEYFILYANGLIGKHYETGEYAPAEYAVIDAHNSRVTGIAEVPAEYGFGGTVAVSDKYIIWFFGTDGSYYGRRWVNTYKNITSQPGVYGAGKIRDIAWDKQRNRMIVLSATGVDWDYDWTMVSELLPDGNLKLIREENSSMVAPLPIKILDLHYYNSTAGYNDLLMRAFMFNYINEDGTILPRDDESYCNYYRPPDFAETTLFKTSDGSGRIGSTAGMGGIAITNTYVRGFTDRTTGAGYVYEKLKFYDLLEQNYNSFGSIELLTPENNFTSQENRINFTYNINSSEQIKNCTLTINDQIINILDINFTSENYTSTIFQGLDFYVYLENGNYTWNIDCLNMNNQQIYSEVRNLFVNHQLPECNIADIDGLGSVDFADLQLFIDAINQIDYCGYADINQDSIVDASDYIALKENFGFSTGNCTRQEVLCDLQSNQTINMEIKILSPQIPQVKSVEEQAEEFCNSIIINSKKDNDKCNKADFLKNEKKNPKDCTIKNKKCVARSKAD